MLMELGPIEDRISTNCIVDLAKNGKYLQRKNVRLMRLGTAAELRSRGVL